MKHILISGGTGLVGTRLTELLIQQGFEVSYLSRKSDLSGKIKKYEWNVQKQTIDKEAFTNTDAIIHLAGAGVADKSWTPEHKKDILESRVKGSELLVKSLKEIPNKVQKVVSATAIGIYGDSGDKLMSEESPYSTDFLAEVCKQWENSLDKLTVPQVKIRVGIVLTTKGGALPKMIQPIQYYAGSALGSGTQMMSWIHLDDLCNMFIYALKNSLSGVYNGVCPNPVNNSEMTKAIAKTIQKPLLPSNVPRLALKTMLGEMASLVLAGSKVSSKKIEQAGFQFQYANLELALSDLIKNGK